MKTTPSFSIIAQRTAAAALLLLGLTITIATSRPPCDKNADCGDGLVCIDGDCIDRCASDSDCSDGYVCTDQNECSRGATECTPGVDCEAGDQAQTSWASDDGSAGLDVMISPSVFSTSNPAQTRGRLELAFVAPASTAAENTEWTLTMSRWGIEKTLTVPLSNSAATVTALEFGLDPDDEPCSTAGGCLLQFELRRADGTGLAVDITATVTVTLPEEPQSPASVTVSWSAAE